MQDYNQQQQYYAGYTPAGSQLQQQQQQQQNTYTNTTANGEYGLYGGYNNNYSQQQQQQQQLPQVESYNGYTSNNNNNTTTTTTTQWAQNYQNYQQPEYNTNETLNGGNYTQAPKTTTTTTATTTNTNNASLTSHMYDNSTIPGAESSLSFGYEAPTPALNTTDINGLRWTWSTYPNTIRESKPEPTSAASLPVPEMIIPLACMYTPLKPIEAGQLIIGDPAARGQQCPNCGAFWNKHCYREEGKFWVCLSCLRRNPTPPSYSPQHPALHYDTVEYILPSPVSEGVNSNLNLNSTGSITHPTFIFIIDTCLPMEEIDALKSNLVRCLNWLPPQSLIGFISFGARVSVWELGTSAISRCYSIRGERMYDPAELSSMLQLNESRSVRGRFLVPLDECEFVLTTLIEELQCDDGVTPGNKRPLRTTGTAVSIAVRLLESLYQNSSNNNSSAQSPYTTKAGRLLLFTGGPCTRGPGTVVSIEKEQMMRFHRDIIDGETPHYEAAFKMYNGLQQRLSEVHASLDVFAESFDQVGILEMRQAVNQTGGTFVCGDAFNHQMFAISLQRYFDRCDLRIRASEENNNNTSNNNNRSSSASTNNNSIGITNYIVRSAFGVKFEVHTSADTLVSGVLGPCIVDEKANKLKPHRTSSPIHIGVSGTTRWCVSTIDQAVTYTFVFDTATRSKKDTSDTVKNTTTTNNNNSNTNNTSNDAKRRFVQFVTRFSTPNGELRVRVTSIVLPVAPSTPTIDPQFFVRHQVFDQTCAATVLARMVVSILEKHPSKWDDTKRWLDTLLVRFVRKYGTFTVNMPESLRLSPCLALFPSFIFNLRRSEYFMVLNISPDETAFKRHWLMREPVETCVMMIQPTLHSYDIESPFATPVPLDSCSLRPDNILLMDAYFNIHIMWGTTIYAWIQAKYHEDPEYAYFAQLLDIVESDAITLLHTRYPYPRFSRTDANGSEARHIKTRMNPTTTHHSNSIGGISNSSSGYSGGVNNSNSGGGDQADVIYTDEASIKKFMESLKQAVVSPNTNSIGNGGR